VTTVVLGGAAIALVLALVADVRPDGASDTGSMPEPEHRAGS
jgi:hypothetical protein